MGEVSFLIFTVAGCILVWTPHQVTARDLLDAPAGNVAGSVPVNQCIQGHLPPVKGNDNVWYFKLVQHGAYMDQWISKQAVLTVNCSSYINGSEFDICLACNEMGKKTDYATPARTCEERANAASLSEPCRTCFLSGCNNRWDYRCTCSGCNPSTFCCQYSVANANNPQCDCVNCDCDVPGDNPGHIKVAC